ncbi:hypothetical protein IW261DRAFT_720093 [Armillaria novae-zelandiae]|uniref:Uncharacterized protein n=1 Tax=Armillaria novae-zelandiae TaxID=153914 RepID=A0AA39NWE8_9AGAR|nr:hypothetical protein IW261DRAFT_720093 [Armillaria novae-zelandiae]
MDSDDELPHWSVLIGRNAGGSGTKNKEVRAGKRKAFSSPTSGLKTKVPPKSPKKRRTNTGKAKTIPAVSEIIELSSDDEQVKCPTAVRSRSSNIKSPFNMKAEKRLGLGTRSPGTCTLGWSVYIILTPYFLESNNTPTHGARTHATAPASRQPTSYFGRLYTGHKLECIPRAPIESANESMDVVPGKEKDEDARSMTLDAPADSETPVNLSRTYFERICKWVGHEVDFNVGRINLRGSNTL